MSSNLQPAMVDPRAFRYAILAVPVVLLVVVGSWYYTCMRHRRRLHATLMLLPPSERLEALERLAGRRPNNPYAAVEPPKLVDVYLGAKSDVEKEGKRMELWSDILPLATTHGEDTHGMAQVAVLLRMPVAATADSTETSDQLDNETHYLPPPGLHIGVAHVPFVSFEEESGERAKD